MARRVKLVAVIGCNSYLERAGVAQLVEHLLPKQRVDGSSPFSRSIHFVPPISQEPR